MTAKTGFRHKSPGPKYILSTTIGPECTDPTIKSSPAYFIGTFLRSKVRINSPGPKYDISGYGPKGKLFSPAFYFGTKPQDTYPTRISPSPHSYGAHLSPDLKHVRPPAWELGDPFRKSYKMSGPAPKYMLPPIVGNTPPDKPSAPAFTLLGRDALKMTKTSSPGPGKYGPTDPSVYYTRAPSPAILPKRKQSTIHSQTIPGPKYFSQYNWKTEPPSYSFGVKHSMYKVITYLPEDKQPFYGI